MESEVNILSKIKIPEFCMSHWLLRIPLVGLMFMDDTWDRFVNKYVSAWTSECWQNSKHERVCRGDNTCKFGRNFCTENVFRWREE